MSCDTGPLDPLELASGIVTGSCREAPALPRVRQPPTVRSALEGVVLPALRRPPCVVSFSGGRDSSAVLAVATDAARRHGLPPPIPVTLRFPGQEPAAEDEWQTLVIRHLGLTAWDRVEVTDELDVIGPYARQVLRRHGVLWPMNTHFHAPVFERASGGSVLTGFGGDEVLRPSTWGRTSMLRAGRAIPRVGDLPRATLACAPRPVRRVIVEQRSAISSELPWLRPHARRMVERRYSADAAGVAVRFDTMLRRSWWRSCYRRRVCASLRMVALDSDVAVRHPLQDAQVIVAFAARAGSGGYWSRTAATRDLFGDLLPAPIVERRSKASFDAAFWHRYARAFVKNWDGRGIDDDLVDVDALCRLWTRDSLAPGLTWLLLQQAWLAAGKRSAPGES